MHTPTLLATAAADNNQTVDDVLVNIGELCIDRQQVFDTLCERNTRDVVHELLCLYELYLVSIRRTTDGSQADGGIVVLSQRPDLVMCTWNDGG